MPAACTRWDTFPAWNRWAEWNGKYRDDLRDFLKGDAWVARRRRMTDHRFTWICTGTDTQGINASVNFITCHDGFTLYDLYSYNDKHNEANGWDNTDGSRRQPQLELRCRRGHRQSRGAHALVCGMIRNACAVLMCSRGTPMFLAGDEFGNTQYGNNNAYCQDNEISWLDWSLLEKNRELFEFFRFMTDFRHKHRVIRENTAPCSCGLPSMSSHGAQPWKTDFTWEDRTVGIMFAGWNHGDDVVYVGINAYWEPVKINLPTLPQGSFWMPVVDTYRGAESIISGEEILEQWEYICGPRSVAVFVAGA